MSLYGSDDSNANKTKAGIGVATDSQTKTIVYIDETEAALAQNKARGLNAPGWWSYFTYNDSSGTARHKAEQMVFIAGGEANSGETQADDTLAGDFLSTVSIGTQPSDASVAATNTQAFAVVATPTGAASGIDGKANAGNTGGRTAGTYVITGTGGTGSGIKVTVVVANNGSANVSLTNGGGGYTDNDTITLSRTGAYGGASDITVKVNGINNGTLTYQWQKRLTSSGRFANVSGATSASLVLSSQAAGNTGNQYRVRVNNGVGATEVVSNTATLTFAS